MKLVLYYSDDTVVSYSDVIFSIIMNNVLSFQLSNNAIIYEVDLDDLYTFNFSKI